MQKELGTLEFDAKKHKIDHQPHGSKDVSDSMAGVCLRADEAARDCGSATASRRNSRPGSSCGSKARTTSRSRKERFDKRSYMNRVRAEQGLVEMEET